MYAYFLYIYINKEKIMTHKYDNSNYTSHCQEEGFQVKETLGCMLH